MRWLTLVLLAVLAAGCSVAPPRPDAGGAVMPVAEWQPPAPPARWSLEGRAAIRVADDGGTMSVRWRARDERYRLNLSGPLGAGAVQLTGDGKGVTLRTRDGRRRSAASARALLRRETGYDLPVRYLRWWVRGRAVPGLGGEVRLDDEGRAATLHQGRWEITYGDYREVGGHWLPGRLSVAGEGVRVRLAVRRWQVAP